MQECEVVPRVPGGVQFEFAAELIKGDPTVYDAPGFDLMVVVPSLYRDAKSLPNVTWQGDDTCPPSLVGATHDHEALKGGNLHMLKIAF